MKKGLKLFGLLFILIIILILINFSSANFQLADDSSYEIEITYGPSENIKGWINISLKDEFSDSLISSRFNDDIKDNIKLIDFLNANSAKYNCTPTDCEKNYASSNEQKTKSFSMGAGEEKIISFFIGEGNINSIKELRFNVSVDNLPTCANPLKIDILDDDIVEWKANKFLSGFFCTYEQGTGCFDSSANTTNVRIDDTPFCEKITLIENSNFSLGAWIKKKTTPWYNGLLEMRLYDLNGLLLASCNLPEPETFGWETSCSVEYDNPGINEYYVCLKAEDGKSTDYEIKKEEVEPCGFYAFPGQETEYHDYYIFGKGARFNDVGEFIINQQEYENQGNPGLLSDYISNYLDDKYNKDCSNGCSIPIKFKSAGNLDIIVSNASLDYSTGSGPQIPKDSIYDTVIEKAKISSGFQKLILEKANLSVPSNVGDYSFELELNDEQILKEDIYILSVPKIQDVIPHDAPSLVPVQFIALVNETGNMTYIWDFGDNTTQETSTTKTKEHTYSSVGIYQLKLTIKNQFGNSSKIVQINVGSPKDYINKTIQEYKEKINDLESEMNQLPLWIKKEINNFLDIEKLRADIKIQEDDYEEALSDEDYTEIMNNLLGIKLPNSMAISQALSPSQIFPSPEQINLDTLEYFGAGSGEENEELYSLAITEWLRNNLDITLESKTYSLYYDEEEPLYSYIKITLTPKQNLNEIYFLVNGNADEVRFKDYEAEKYNEDLGIVFLELTEPKTIEFLYPGKINAGNIPIYVSPKFSYLELQTEPEVCNFNKRCEKELGENYKNCRSDCKPLGWTIFWFIVLFFIAFVVYIILQEWYKRYYESHLFKSKNHLFNLVNFMNNAESQGIKKSKIFSNLKDVGWNTEQLNYAWNKLHGKRTGMWEIPIFKWVEKRQVKRELEKRKSAPENLNSFGKV